MDVASWLRDLGLERYEATFLENGVSAEVVCLLTADDLRELGVAAVGHRRQLLEAIAKLREDAASLQAAMSIDDHRASTSPAERRQITVLFCDIVGSTPLSTGLDPEELREILTTYQANVGAVVAGEHGYIARFVGDGVLAYFGWPNPDEAHAESAVRAGLAIIDAISAQRLSVRIGIATGLVVTGDLVGVGAAQTMTAVGETPNLAARLQALAQPDTVVVSEATQTQLGHLFDLEDLGLHTLKGFDTPVRPWRVLGKAEAVSRSEVVYANAFTPLVGRDEELGLLLRRWHEAKSGEGRVVLLSGEAGIGKSRLLAALEERLAGEPHSSLRYFCSPHHQDSPLYPLIARLEREAGFTRGDTAADRLTKLEAVLAPTAPPTEEVALLAALLSVPTNGRHPVLELSPQQKKMRTFTTLLKRLSGLARREPVLMLFEDAHWSDPSSVELLEAVIEQVPDLPVLLVVSFRPEFVAPWFGRPRVSLMALSRLDRRDATALAARVVKSHVLSSPLLDRIVMQSDGVPLFIEELSKAVLEASELGTEGATLAVPNTLQASLMARLDRLPAAKMVAQIGSVIGREFAHILLAAVAEMPEGQLADGVDSLVASGLAFRRGSPPDADYTFKHALVRDAAYSTLLRSQRQELHARIGKMLEEQFQETADTQPELLAHHFTQAGLIDRAIEFWRLAGLHSVGRSAHSEAGAHFGCALDLLGKLPPSEQRDRRELDLTLGLAVSLIAVHGFGGLRVEECALRAVELSGKLCGSPNQFAARRLAWNSCLMRQPVPKAVALAQDLIGVADQDKSSAKLAVAHRALGYSLLIAGEFPKADEILTRGAALAEAVPDHEFAVYGEHPGMVCRAYGGKAKILTGFPTCGALLVEEAVAHARREENAHSLAWALGVAAHIFQIHHEVHQTARFASEAIDTARDHHLPQWLALGERCMGWAMHQLGNSDGLDLQLQGMKRWTDTGAVLHLTHCEVHLVESLLREDRIAEARSHLDAARTHCASYGEAYLSAEIDRLEALLLRYEQAADEIVEECLAKSLNTARRQGAHLFELRTATTFARVLVERDERRRAVDLLAPVYGWFIEGFETTDLKEARTLLNELG